MVSAAALRRTLAGRDVAVAYAVVVALYFAGHLGFQPLQIPWYLFIVAYDVVESTLPAITAYHTVGFPLFLYLLAVGGAAVARWARSGDAGSDWYRAAGGTCLVVAALSLGFAGLVGGPLVAARDNPTPLAITGTTGLVFLAGGWWLLERDGGEGSESGRLDPDQSDADRP